MKWKKGVVNVRRGWWERIQYEELSEGSFKTDDLDDGMDTTASSVATATLPYDEKEVRSRHGFHHQREPASVTSFELRSQKEAMEDSLLDTVEGDFMEELLDRSESLAPGWRSKASVFSGSAEEDLNVGSGVVRTQGDNVVRSHAAGCGRIGYGTAASANLVTTLAEDHSVDRIEASGTLSELFPEDVFVGFDGPVEETNVELQSELNEGNTWWATPREDLFTRSAAPKTETDGASISHTLAGPTQTPTKIPQFDSFEGHVANDSSGGDNLLAVKRQKAFDSTGLSEDVATDDVSLQREHIFGRIPEINASLMLEGIFDDDHEPFHSKPLQGGNRVNLYEQALVGRENRNETAEVATGADSLRLERIPDLEKKMTESCQATALLVKEPETFDDCDLYKSPLASLGMALPLSKDHDFSNSHEETKDKDALQEEGWFSHQADDTPNCLIERLDTYSDDALGRSSENALLLDGQREDSLSSWPSQTGLLGVQSQTDKKVQSRKRRKWNSFRLSVRIRRVSRRSIARSSMSELSVDYGSLINEQESLDDHSDSEKSKVTVTSVSEHSSEGDSKLNVFKRVPLLFQNARQDANILLCGASVRLHSYILSLTRDSFRWIILKVRSRQIVLDALCEQKKCLFWESPVAYAIYGQTWLSIVLGRPWILWGALILIFIQVWWFLMKWVLYVLDDEQIWQSVRFLRGWKRILVNSGALAARGLILGSGVLYHLDASASVVRTVVRRFSQTVNSLWLDDLDQQRAEINLEASQRNQQWEDNSGVSCSPRAP